EVVGRQLHGIEIEGGSVVDEIIVGHRRLRLLFQIEILAIAIAGDAEADVRLAGPADRINGGDGGGYGETGDGGLKKTAAGRHGDGSERQTTEAQRHRESTERRIGDGGRVLPAYSSLCAFSVSLCLCGSLLLGLPNAVRDHVLVRRDMR